MKSILIFSIILIVSLPHNLLAGEGFEDILFVPAPVSGVEVLPKYSRQNAKVWLTGIFSSGCYSWSHTEIVVNEVKVFTISLHPIAQFYTGFCTMALHNYDRVVHLGVLNPGHYQILVQMPDGKFIERNTLIE